jgi:hypothetical protein
MRPDTSRRRKHDVATCTSRQLCCIRIESPRKPGPTIVIALVIDVDHHQWRIGANQLTGTAFAALYQRDESRPGGQ